MARAADAVSRQRAAGMRCAVRGASFAEYIMKAFFIEAAIPFHLNPGPASGQQQLCRHATSGTNYDKTTATDPDPTLLLFSDFARSSGIIESPLLNGSIYAWGIHQPGESYYAQADLSGGYYPKITPFTEVTLSGRVSAQLTGTVEDAGSSFSTASMSITFARQTFWRYISLRGDAHTLDEEFSLTFTNDTDRTLDFDWYSYAQVNAPVPEPSQSTMLVLGFGLLGLQRQSRLALRPNMRHSASSYDSISPCA